MIFSFIKSIFHFLKKILKITGNFFKKIYLILKDEELHSTVIGFILTSFLVGILSFTLNSNFQKQESERQKRFEIFRFNLEKKSDTINLVSSKIDSRYLYAMRVLANTSSHSDWNNYMQSVQDWNISREQMRLNMAIYYDWNFASEFISDINDSNEKNPKTIHYKFVRLHNLLVSIKNGDYSKIKEAQNLLNEISMQKDKLLTQMIEDLRTNSLEVKY